jgi:hypothetical protein
MINNLENKTQLHSKDLNKKCESISHTDIHCSIEARKYDFLEIIGVEMFALNMNSRIECHREDRENLKPANISTHTVPDCLPLSKIHILDSSQLYSL